MRTDGRSVRAWAAGVMLLGGLVVAGWAQEPAGERGFEEVGRLPGATAAHGAVRLGNGDVLVVGGYGKVLGVIPLASTLARVYEPERRSWRALAGTLRVGRVSPAVVRVGEDVLVIGGRGQDNRAVRAIERYDAAAERFEVVGELAVGRLGPRATVLGDGRVLVTGESRQVEIIERGAEGEWTVRAVKGENHFRHTDHAAVLLADGRVLLAGGRTDRLEIFDPAGESYTACEARLGVVVDDQAAVRLYDGRVLLAGGQEVYTNRSVGAWWVYDPAGDAMERHEIDWSEGGSGAEVGAADLAVADVWGEDEGRQGRWILLCGGEYDPGRGGEKDVVLDVAWLYDAAAGAMRPVGPMRHRHDETVAVRLAGSAGEARVLIVGGYGAADSFHSNCEEFVWQWEERQ